MSTASSAYRRTIRRRRATAVATVGLVLIPLAQAAAGDQSRVVADGGPSARPVAAHHGDATLAGIALCESGGDATAVSPDWRYRGKYQFDLATWREVGGAGDPAAAPEAEQDMRARVLLERRGVTPWPVCGPGAR